MLERRADERTRTVFRPALMEAEGFSGFCLVRNISSKGLRASIYTRVAKGTRIGIQLGPEITVYGAVVWATEGEIGVVFDRSIDVPGVLENLASPRSDGRVNRAPRLSMTANGHVMTDGKAFPVTLLDISQRGAKIAGLSANPGDELTLCLEGLRPQKAIVRWSRPDYAGLHFLTPLGFEYLGSWVISRQRRHGPPKPDPQGLHRRLRSSQTPPRLIV